MDPLMKQNSPVLNQALEAWRIILDNSHAISAGEALEATQTATFDTEQQVAAILKPGSRDEVQACVRIANEYRIPLYPVSCGKNWGMGSRVPVRDKCVVMELSRMNRIIDYNERFACLTVEPGVTFQQAYEFLQEQGSNLFLAVTGGPAEGSLTGNTLERGDSIGPHGERLDHICGLEVILPTGECVHTGFGRWRQAKASKLHRWGVGPVLDGLFTQSNLGIVTEMTMWLARRPAYYQIFQANIVDKTSLGAFFDTVQPLVMKGVIPGNCMTVGNSYKVMSIIGRYPWKKMSGTTPFDLEAAKGAAPWLAAGSLYSACKDIGLAERNLIENTIQGCTNRVFFRSQEHYTPESNIGVPSNQNIRSTYWRKKTAWPATMDPDRDACGVIWQCTALPFDGETIIPVVEEVETMVHKHGYEPNIALHCVSGRIVHLILALMYDREVSGEDDRAMACYDAVLERLTAQDYFPYRLGIQSMDALPPADDGYGSLMQTLKNSLDPNDILAPGRYDFRTGWPS